MVVPRQKRKMIGELLVEGGVITTEQLDKALAEQRRRGGRIGEVLKSLEYVSEKTMIEFIGRQMGIPHTDLSSVSIDPSLVKIIPETMARRHQVVPLYQEGRDLTVAMVDPLNVFAIDDIRRLTHCEILPTVATEREVLRAIDRYYSMTESMEEVVRGIDDQKAVEEERPGTLEMMAEETPVVKLVNMIILQGVRERSSDIHVEPDADALRIRYRVDGLLREVMSPPKHLHAGLTSRLKIQAGLDIAEKRVSQDGRFQMMVSGRSLDIRLSTLPTIFGEKIVMRILDKTTGLVPLEDLGISAEQLPRFKQWIHRPYGFILVTGPTGSGKTTTLYSALNVINSIQKNIITIEDPVEYQIRLINQVQVNPKAGVTFAGGLRSIVRQDPDIIMVGEIRDRETANIAIQAALTGHLVFSTLHTNDAAGAVARLVEMEIEPFLIASSLVGVVGQRLVRKVCSRCRITYPSTPELLEDLGLPGDQAVEFVRGQGCNDCRETGYAGRAGIFELMPMTEGIRRLVVGKASSAEIRQQAIREGMRTLREEGLRKALSGVTSVEEVLQVTLEEGE
ncbi:MAG: Flp pilus assembly complex ATPase component TadA [Nitrospirae bacterium]|nr:Flp pilus assembly complex ATPase component TadA [Nitrospirota bacterium]